MLQLVKEPYRSSHFKHFYSQETNGAIQIHAPSIRVKLETHDQHVVRLQDTQLLCAFVHNWQPPPNVRYLSP